MDWLKVGEKRLIPLEHYTRLNDMAARNMAIMIKDRDGTLRGEPIYILDYGNGKTWFQLLHTRDKELWESTANQLLRFVDYIKKNPPPKVKSVDWV